MHALAVFAVFTSLCVSVVFVYYLLAAWLSGPVTAPPETKHLVRLLLETLGDPKVGWEIQGKGLYSRALSIEVVATDGWASIRVGSPYTVKFGVLDRWRLYRAFRRVKKALEVEKGSQHASILAAQVFDKYHPL